MMQEKIIEALNSAIPNTEDTGDTDYVQFLTKTHAGLQETDKRFFLNMALVTTPKIFFDKITRFLTYSVCTRQISKIEKIQFAYFVKTINDLCFNNPILLNLKGDIQDAWTYYRLNESSDPTHHHCNIKDVQSILTTLLTNAGFSITNQPDNGEITESISKEFQDRTATLITSLKGYTHNTLFVKHEQDICVLFMLHQDIFIEYCIKLSPTSISLHDLCVLWNIDLKLVECCVKNIEKCKKLLQANISFCDLAPLSEIEPHLFSLLLEKASDIAPLTENDWLSMEHLLQCAKKNPKDCKIYLENLHQLALFKAANVPFAVLITGNADTNCYRTETILSAVQSHANFIRLIQHSQARTAFHLDLQNSLKPTTIFISACVRNEIFRILIQEPDKIHRLLDNGFDFGSLCVLHTNLNLMLAHIQDVLSLLSNAIPIDIFTYWLRNQLPLLELLNHGTELLNLKTIGIDLKSFAALIDLYPQHALIILKKSNNPHRQWWIKQQLKTQQDDKKPKPLRTVKAKYRIFFDLDGTLVSQVKKHDRAWTQEFQQKRLYVTAYGDYIIHPGVIECLRWLHLQGIETGIYSAGDKERNIKLVEKIYAKAFQNPIYHASTPIIPVSSREHMRGSPFKDLKDWLKLGENINQMLLVDDDKRYQHPEQRANFMQITPATDEIFAQVYQKKPPHAVQRAVDHIYCAVGIIAQAIKIAEKTGCTLTAGLAEVLEPTVVSQTTLPTNIENSEHSNTLFQYQTYYAKGLKKLKAINPQLQFSTAGRIFSDEYTLHPSTYPLMATPADDAGHAATTQKPANKPPNVLTKA